MNGLGNSIESFKEKKMSSDLSKEKVLDFLKRIEEGEIKITPLSNPKDIYSGNVVYSASNGWELTIFNDANTWDYIDSIRTDDGVTLGFDDLDVIPEIRNYCPSLEVSKEVYLIPKV